MERATTAPDSNDGYGEPAAWTNEKHVHFLNSMEASFIRTMFENSGHLLRLDRQLPDTSDSTLDLKKKHRPNNRNNKKKHVNSAADIIGFGSRSRSNVDSQADKRARRQSYHQYTPSQDQVVPEMENRIDDKDESGPPNVHMAVTPAN